MFAKSFFASALLATGALAAPTVSQPTPAEIDKRAEWKTGKCEAHIFVESKKPQCQQKETKAQVANNLHPPVPTISIFNGATSDNLYWKVDIIDNPGANIGKWGVVLNPLEKDRKISTSKGHEFSIRGQPFHGSSQDRLTLNYDSQEWNGNDCFNYIYKSPDFGTGYKTQHSWWCQFDC